MHRITHPSQSAGSPASNKQGHHSLSSATRTYSWSISCISTSSRSSTHANHPSSRYSRPLERCLSASLDQKMMQGGIRAGTDQTRLKPAVRGVHCSVRCIRPQTLLNPLYLVHTCLLNPIYRDQQYHHSQLGQEQPQEPEPARANAFHLALPLAVCARGSVSTGTRPFTTVPPASFARYSKFGSNPSSGAGKKSASSSTSRSP